MDEVGLERLSRAELLELLRRQEAELAEREATIRALEEELAQFRRPAKTPENSSVPPSTGQKANLVEQRGRKRGPKRGHVGVSRRRSEPDVVVACRPTVCRGCGGALPELGGQRVGRSQVVELPSVEPVVIEAQQYAVVCLSCGTQTTGEYPVGLEPRRTFGPRIEALLGYLHERHHVSYARLVEVCRDLCGLTISQGGIDRVLGRLAERARPTSETIRETVRGSPIINSDETSARVGGKTWWHWVFQTPEASYHLIAPSRAGAVIDAFLGDAAPEVWGSDLYAPQMLTEVGAHQVCLSHQDRDLTFAREADTGEERRWAVELQRLFGRAIRLHHERGQVTPDSFTRRRVRIETATERLLSGWWLAPTSEAHRLQKRYRAHRDALYVFLHRDDVEPTNNSSERDLRTSVIHRKVTGGYRSARGAEGSAILTSVGLTARKRGENVFNALYAIAGPSPLQGAYAPR